MFRVTVILIRSSSNKICEASRRSTVTRDEHIYCVRIHFNLCTVVSHVRLQKMQIFIYVLAEDENLHIY